MEKSSRIAWIDEFKGLVLLLVCTHHLDQHFLNIDLGTAHLACLRMAAFFFISGVLFSSRRFPNFKDYFLHKSKVLLLPYVSLSLIFLALDPVVYNFELYSHAQKVHFFYQAVTIDNVWQYIGMNLENILLEGMSATSTAALWFVFTLYSISLLFYLMQNFAKFVSKKIAVQSCWFEKSFLGVLAVASFAVGYMLSLNKVHLPFAIERDFSTLAYFAAGFICREWIAKFNELVQSRWSWVSVLIAVASFVVYAFIKDPSSWRGFYNNNVSLQLLASSVFGILGLIATMSFLSEFRGRFVQVLLGILRCVSRNGLFVLVVHYWVIIVMKDLFMPVLDKPKIAYVSFAIVVAVVAAAIPLFRLKLYRLVGKEKSSTFY